MASPMQFREFARECIRQAGETRDQRRRQILIDLAKHWMRAALLFERSHSSVDHASLVPTEEAR
jgi:hypothetical protein